MIIPSEKYMLNRIIAYYNETKKRFNGDELEEFTSQIKGIIKYINYGDDCVRDLLRSKLLDDNEPSSSATGINRVYFSIYLYILFIFIFIAPSTTETINDCLIQLYNSDKNAFHLSEKMKIDLQKIGNLVDLIMPIVTDKQTNDKTFLNCLTILLECQIEEPFKSGPDFTDCCTRLLALYDNVSINHQLKYCENNVLECCLLFAGKCIFIDLYYDIDGVLLRDKLGSAKLVSTLQYYNVLKEQDAVTMCETLKAYCEPNDFQCLYKLLHMDVVEDQQFWEYICQCVPMGSQNLQFNPISGAIPGMPGMPSPSGYIPNPAYASPFQPMGNPQVIDPNQPMGYAPPPQQSPLSPPDMYGQPQPSVGNLQPQPVPEVFNQVNLPIPVDQQQQQFYSTQPTQPPPPPPL